MKPDEEEIWTNDDVIKFLKLKSKSQLDWNVRMKGLKPLTISKERKFLKSTVIRWVREQEK